MRDPRSYRSSRRNTARAAGILNNWGYYGFAEAAMNMYRVKGKRKWPMIGLRSAISQTDTERTSEK